MHLTMYSGTMQRQERQLMAGHDAERLGRQVGDAVEHDERRAQAAVGDRRRVGDQAQDGGQERVEAEADHDGAADGDRRAAAGRAFEERAEGEADQDGLDAGVAGQARHRAADDGELARSRR